MHTPQRRQISHFLLVLAALAGPARAEDDLTTALEVFRSWKQGSPVSQLARTRQAVFRGTDDPAVRTAHEAALLAFLRTDADGQAKQRALGWLGDIAGEASVAPMAVLLNDPDLSSAARGVLEQIPGPTANKALVGALQRLTDKARLGVIDSLARRNEASGVTALVQLLKTTEDPFLQDALVTALGIMDSPGALAALFVLQSLMQ